MIKSIPWVFKTSRRRGRRAYSTMIPPSFQEAESGLVSAVSGSFRSILSFVRRTMRLKTVAIFLLLYWISKDFAFAEDAVKTTAESVAVSSKVDSLNIFLAFLQIVISPLVMLTGWLLSPDWTYGEILGLRPILHQLWIYVSNIVYVVFAFILVYIAIINIFTDKAKGYELKQALPKLVIGILMVPFTWFVVSGALSIGNYLTINLIRLPVTVSNVTNALNGMDSKIIPTEITLDRTTEAAGQAAAADPTLAGMGNFGGTDCSVAGTACKSIKDILSDTKGGAYNLLAVYAYGIFKVQSYQVVEKSQDKSTKTLMQLAEKMLVGGVHFFVFGILLLAIFFALISRIFRLWLFAIFSPLFALGYFFGGSGMAKGLEKHNLDLKTFISLALVPTYVAAALAFGLMFLASVMSTNTYSTPTQLKSDIIKVELQEASQTQIFTFGDTFKFKSVGSVNKELGLANSVFDGGKLLTGKLIIDFLAIAVLWAAVMVALKSNKITEAAVKPFSDMGDMVGKMIAQAPKYMPLPVPGGNIAAMEIVGRNLSNIPDRIAGMKANKSALNQYFEKKAGIATGAIEDEAKLKQILGDGKFTSDSEFKDAQDILKRIAHRDGTRSQNYRNAFKQFAEVAEKSGRDALPTLAKTAQNMDTQGGQRAMMSLLYAKNLGDGNLKNEINGKSIDEVISQTQTAGHGEILGLDADGKVKDSKATETSTVTGTAGDANGKARGIKVIKLTRSDHYPVSFDVVNGGVQLDDQTQKDIASIYGGLYKKSEMERFIADFKQNSLNTVNDAGAKTVWNTICNTDGFYAKDNSSAAPSAPPAAK